MPNPSDQQSPSSRPTDGGHRPEPEHAPASRGRLGFSRVTLSLVGLLLICGFLIWLFLP